MKLNFQNSIRNWALIFCSLGTLTMGYSLGRQTLPPPQQILPLVSAFYLPLSDRWRQKAPEGEFFIAARRSKQEQNALCILNPYGVKVIRSQAAWHLEVPSETSPAALMFLLKALHSRDHLKFMDRRHKLPPCPMMHRVLWEKKQGIYSL